MKKPDAVILPFDLRYNGAFKVERVEEERPEIIFISSSRAGALRASMFKPYRFYNLSFTAWTTGQITDVFERATRNVHPRIAIVSLDYFLFTDDWERGYSGTRSMIFDRPLRYLKSSLGDFVRAVAQHPTIFRDYLRSPSRLLGPEAIITQQGFRNDGSYLYSLGHIEQARLHDQTADFLVQSMPGAPKMSERQTAPLVRLSEIARQRGIKLIAVQLPYVRAGVEYLDHNEAYRRYSGVWRDFESDSTRQWLKSIGISFFDLAHSTIDDQSENFVDAYHISELGAVRVMQELLAQPEFRADFPAIELGMTEHQLRDGEVH